jgi:hypothetical protein
MNSMFKMTTYFLIVLSLLVLSAILIAQENPKASQNQSNGQNEHVKVQGCVSKTSGDFILMQTDPGNSYVLEANRNLKLEPYLGHQVEVTGTESPTMSSSSNYRRAPGASITITVASITTISKRCTH